MSGANALPVCGGCTALRAQIAELAAAVAGQGRQLAALSARVGQLEAERRRGARDRHDVPVMAAVIASEALGARFTSGEVYRLAPFNEALRSALDAAFIDNPVALGLCFRRMTGVAVDGWVLERTDAIDREGIVWHLRRCEG